MAVIVIIIIIMIIIMVIDARQVENVASAPSSDDDADFDRVKYDKC